MASRSKNRDTKAPNQIKTSELVWLYIKRRPFLKSSLSDGIVNCSALARKIAYDALGDSGKEDAVKMALVRLARKFHAQEDSLEARILKVLKGSSLSVRSKVSIIISSKELHNIKSLSYVESKGGITYIVDGSELERVTKQTTRTKTIIRTETNLNLIVIHSPPSLEETPGVIAHILGVLAEEGINVVEFVSCYTDTLLVVRQPDTVRTYELLSGLMA